MSNQPSRFFDSISGNISLGIEFGECSSYVLAMRIQAFLRLWETAHGSLRGNLKWLHEFRTRSETERIVRFPDDDIERCVSQEVRLAKILALLEATSERPPEYPDLLVQNPPNRDDDDNFPHFTLDGWADEDPDEIQEYYEFSGEDWG